MPLSSQDERMLFAHLDICESCARFQHQLDQVTQAACEVTMLEECIPDNLELLARQIMQALPQKKPGFLDFLKRFFQFGNLNKHGEGKQKTDRKTANTFPHLKRLPSDAEEPENIPAGKDFSREDDLRVASARLRNLSKLQSPAPDSNQPQTTSLGHKFGVAVPPPGAKEEKPLTLAESIRRKVIERKQRSLAGTDSPKADLASQENQAYNLPNTTPANTAADYKGFEAASDLMTGALPFTPEPVQQQSISSQPVQSPHEIPFQTPQEPLDNWNRLSPGSSWDIGTRNESPIPAAPLDLWSVPKSATSIQGSSEIVPQPDQQSRQEVPVPQQKTESKQLGWQNTWSEEAEQIQTGMWQVFSLDESGLGTPKTHATKAGESPDRWDVPVQQRIEKTEKVGQPTSGSITDRLTNILGEDLTSLAANTQNLKPKTSALPFTQESIPQAPASPGSVSAGSPGPIPAVPVPPMPLPQAPMQIPQNPLSQTPFDSSVPSPVISPVRRQNALPKVDKVDIPLAPDTSHNVQEAIPFDVLQMSSQAETQAVIPAIGSLSQLQKDTTFHERLGLLGKIDDTVIDRIFRDNLGVTEKPHVDNLSTLPHALPSTPVSPEKMTPPPYTTAPATPTSSSASESSFFKAVPPPAPVLENLTSVPESWSNPSSNQELSRPQPVQPVAPTPRLAEPLPPKQHGGGIIQVDDATMDKIFADNLGVKERGMPRINMREAVQSIRQVAEMQPPKIEGIGRLDKRADATAEVSIGKISSIGKFLLDQQDLVKIGNLTKEDLTDTKVRVLTLEAADEINKLLQHIANQPGVVGSVIVGHDGILIANNLPKELDPEAIGVWALGIYVNTTNASKKISHNHVHQLVAKSQQGYLVIADFGGGILVTVSNGQGTDSLIPLMRSITQLVAQ